MEESRSHTMLPLDVHKDLVVYRDEQYILGQKDAQAYLIADGKKYSLSCHPYEPCLYITDERGFQTAVHNAFDPYVVLDCFHEGKTVSSITGFTYKPKDFCRMVESASKMGDAGIDDAEEALKTVPEDERTGDDIPVPNEPIKQHKASMPQNGHIIHDRQFENLISYYPDIVIDYAIVKSDHAKMGLNAHRHVLELACRELLYDGDEMIWDYDTGVANGCQISSSELFGTENHDGGLNYRKAFLCPPHETEYDGKDFDLVNSILFPYGTDKLEVYTWDTGWSDYFNDGREWWGTLCITIYDGSVDRFVVIMASATD